jgi:hypothetical protein
MSTSCGSVTRVEPSRIVREGILYRTTRGYAGGVSDEKPLEVSPPVYWPAEWAVERGFWREVAARTVAGVLTLVILGVPTLIYASVFGLLKGDQLGPILIGIAGTAAIVLGYILVLRMIRKRTERTVAAKKFAKAADLRRALLTPEELARIKEEAEKEINETYRRSRAQSFVTTAVAVLFGIAAALLPALLR